MWVNKSYLTHLEDEVAWLRERLAKKELDYETLIAQTHLANLMKARPAAPAPPAKVRMQTLPPMSRGVTHRERARAWYIEQANTLPPELQDEILSEVKPEEINVQV